MESKKEKKREERVKPGGHPPRYYLGESVQLAIDIYEKAGGNATLDEFSDITGNTRKSSSFVRKLQTLKHYGLVVTDEENIRLSDIGERIAAPQDQAEKNAALKTAFLQIEPFQLVYEKFVGKILPQDEFLKNAFTQQENIPQKLASDWIIHFQSSGKFAGLLMDREDGKLQVRGMASDKTPKTQMVNDGHKPENDKPDAIMSESPKPPPQQQFMAKTSYDFLVEIFKGADMTDEEEAAVFTLFRFLKRQHIGPRPVANDGELSSV